MNKARFLTAVLVIMVIVTVIATACQPTPRQNSTGQPSKTAGPASTNYIGQFSLNPSTGIAGTLVKANGTGFAPNTNLEIIWQGFSGSWNVKVKEGEFHGREFKEILEPMSAVTTDVSGRFEARFTVPDGFGFIHDVLVIKDGVIQNKAAFEVIMQASVSPSSGPVGTPITIELRGVGWRPLENSWVLLYDNKFTGWLSAVTTNGFARAVIPAVGIPGKHIIQIVHASATFPYLNMQQSPRPDRPQWTFEFTVTDGAAVLPPPVQNQALPIEQKTTPVASIKSAIWTDQVSGPLGTPVTIRGNGLPSGTQVELLWFTVKGNRVSGQGWDEASTQLGIVTVRTDGTMQFSFPALDDLGGPHRIEARVEGEKLAETAFTITPSVFAIEPSSGPVGTIITIHLKGVGWTETANIYNLVYDNAYVGYACGFNSQGDVTIYLPATGEPGWHFIDLYPGIYKGVDMQQVNDFRIPQLTYIDHPGEKLPAFHFAFQITEGGR